MEQVGNLDMLPVKGGFPGQLRLLGGGAGSRWTTGQGPGIKDCSGGWRRPAWRQTAEAERTVSTSTCSESIQRSYW
jgi:hypothetical protein